MTVSTDAQVESVLESTKSTNPCPPSTLRLLRALLGVDDTTSEHAPNKPVIRIPRQKQGAMVKAVKPTETSYRRINSKFTVLDSPEAPIQCLPHNKQLQLATTTFNKTLKTLGDALKAKHSTSSRTPGQLRSPLKETQGRIKDASKLTSEAVSSKLIKSKSQAPQAVRAQSAVQSTDFPDLLATAECARTSLQCLRRLKAADTSNGEQDTRLEQGALALISKLQGIGLISAAIEETLMLRQSLDNVLRRVQQDPKDGTGRGVCSSYSSLEECIEFEHGADSATSLGLVTAFHIQLLQLISTDPGSRITQNLHERLDLTNPRSPCRMILRGAERGCVSTDKAAHQLHALSQCVLAICPLASQSSARVRASHASQIEQFRLRVLALQMRCHWWRLANHQPNLEREIWSPFHRFLLSLREESGLSTKPQFLLVKRSLEQLVDTISRTQSASTSQYPVQPSPTVLTVLQSMAEATGSTEESLDLLQCLEMLCANSAGIVATVYQCKVASAMLSHHPTQNANCLSTIETALDALDRPLKGTAKDLEQLLLESSRLRKAAATRLSAISEDSGTKSPHDDSNRLLASACARALFRVLHFVLRFASFKPQTGDEFKTSCSSRYPSKIRASLSVAEQSVRSALAAVRLDITHEYVGWEICIVALADCLSVSEILNENVADTSDANMDAENKTTTSVRVSNLYWSRYLKQKDAGACTVDLGSTLTRSIDALKGRTQSEKHTGFLAIKCETAATLCIDLKDFARAGHHLVMAIKTSILAGTLSAVAQRALTQPTRRVWDEADSAQLMLGRVLTAYARLTLRHQPDSSENFFDDAKLKPYERALLLEKQFVALGESSVPEMLHPYLKDVGDVVLSLYNESGYSLHRMRFVSQLLTFCTKSRLYPGNFLPEQALKICVDGSSDEAGLGEKEPCASSISLYSSVSLQWSFSTTAPSVSLLQDFVASHANAIQACDTWASMLPSINDATLVIAQTQAIIDFTDMRGLLQIKLDALLLMRNLLELRSEKDVSALASCTTQIGLQYSRMGYMRKAGHLLAAASKLISECRSKTLVALQWHLAFAEYLTVLSKYKEAKDQLISAQWQYDADFVAEQEHEPRGWRLAQNKYLAQAALVASNLAFEIGDLDTALLHAKRGVKISIRQWTVLERLLGIESASRTTQRSVSRFDLLVDDMSNMTISAAGQPTKHIEKGAAFWAHVCVHFDGLLHLSRMSAYFGSFQDAVYYAEQAKKVADAISADTLRSRASAVLAAHFAQADDFDRALVMIDESNSSCGDIDHATGLFQVFMATADAHLTASELTRGLQAVQDAQKAMYKIQGMEDTFPSCDLENGCSVEAAPIKKAPRSARRVACETRERRPPDRVIDSRVHADVVRGTSIDGVTSVIESSVWIQRMQAEINILNARFCVKSGSYDTAATLLDQVVTSVCSSGTDARSSFLQAATKIHDALRLLQSDAVYSVLAESTVAYPTQQGKAVNDVVREQVEQRDPTYTTVATPSRTRKKAVKKTAAIQNNVSKPRKLLSEALEILSAISSSSFREFSCTFADELCGLLTQAQLLSSLLSEWPPSSPSRIACHQNAPQSLRWSREAAAISADIMLLDKSTLNTWPEDRDFSDAEVAASDSAVDRENLYQRLMDDLPSSWTVVTIALDNDNTEIVMSKIRHAVSAFLIRLPLHRTSSEDLDAKPLSLQRARTELLDIIANANLTAHDAKSRSDRRGKKDWWTAREALDARLQALLTNIETLWLGGFRGIFDDQRHDEELLSRFSESLSRIVDRQLPSRRKVGVNTKPRIQLHSCVLQLFLALGDPDEGDLEDAITDLLYFVIDTYQFQGERNAYDEVDFHTMVLEVMDALRSYHDAAKDILSKSEAHTILVLDKSLHAFPWESLHCLQGRSVSRMPSLSCLQKLLSRVRQDDGRSSGIWIDQRNGAYILNPSSDLASTEETFRVPFSSMLTDYESIFNRAPSEAEFETCLRDKELCLYFGHGSGAQFIRGRTIKRLNRCAVTFLMGCSSSKMVECGQFEPYGVPYNYLHAGSAAVVGTLWDVTDKDIDRFAMKTFVNWGLLGPQAVEDNTQSKASKMKGKAKGKGNGKGVMQKEGALEQSAEDQPRDAIGLDEAVAKARNACVLRYLNGAAPVIYGIPVYLK